MLGDDAAEALQHFAHGLMELRLAGVAAEHLFQDRLQFLVESGHHHVLLVAPARRGDARSDEKGDGLAADGCRLSVLTNKPQAATDRILEALDLRRPLADVIGGDTAYGRKPAPAGLHALIERAGIPPDETVMVGDSWVDLATARHAGIDACLAAYGFGVTGVDADARASVKAVARTPSDIRALAHARPPAPSTPPATRA